MNLRGASHFRFWKRLGFWGQWDFYWSGGKGQLLQPNFHLKYFDPCFTTSGPNGPRSPVLSSLMSDMQVVFQIHLHNNKIHIWLRYKLCIYQAFFQKILSTPILPRGGEVWTVSGSIANDDCVVLSLPLCCGLCSTYQSYIYFKAMASVMEMYSRVRGAQGDNRFVNIITTTRYLDALDDFWGSQYFPIPDQVWHLWLGSHLRHPLRHRHRPQHRLSQQALRQFQIVLKADDDKIFMTDKKSYCNCWCSYWCLY